jgi:hypothetical protein
MRFGVLGLRRRPDGSLLDKLSPRDLSVQGRRAHRGPVGFAQEKKLHKYIFLGRGEEKRAAEERTIWQGL